MTDRNVLLLLSVLGFAGCDTSEPDPTGDGIDTDGQSGDASSGMDGPGADDDDDAGSDSGVRVDRSGPFAR